MNYLTDICLVSNHPILALSPTHPIPIPGPNTPHPRPPSLQMQQIGERNAVKQHSVQQNAKHLFLTNHKRT